MKFGSLGAGSAMSDSDLDQMIAEADPKSREAQQMQQQARVQLQQQAVAQKSNTVRNVLLGLGVIAGAYYLMKHNDND